MGSGLDVSALVSVERGEIDRRIFSDPDIFEAEMEHIFARAWLFLCHESQLRQPGDFFEAPMGRDNVLVVRQKDGTLRALLNTCTHRGNAVCRAEEGNARNFMCPYHGWTFNLAGDLVGVPGFRSFYHEDLDRSQLGLRQVAQLDSYRGFVFATHDPSAPPLPEYLGATGRLSLDLLALRGDVEVIPGIQKFVIDCNWKFAVDNLFDWYHPQVTHMSAVASGLMGPSAREDVVESGGAQTPDGEEMDLREAQNTGAGLDDMIVILGEYGHAIAGPTSKTQIGSSGFGEWRTYPHVKEALGPVGLRVAGHPNVFPTTWMAVTNQLSLRIPRGPFETEIWWFNFVNRSLPPEAQEMQLFIANHIFGPAGVLEQEDGENWAQSTMQTRGTASRHIPQLLRMNLGRGKVVKEHGLARIDGKTNEHGQLWTYAAWAEWMKGGDWDSLRAATEPPDFL